MSEVPAKAVWPTTRHAQLSLADIPLEVVHYVWSKLKPAARQTFRLLDISSNQTARQHFIKALTFLVTQDACTTLTRRHQLLTQRYPCLTTLDIRLQNTTSAQELSVLGSSESITSLSPHCCGNLRPDLCEALLKPFPNVRSLRLRNIGLLTGSTVAIIVACCQHVELLAISAANGPTIENTLPGQITLFAVQAILAGFPKLLKLELYGLDMELDLIAETNPPAWGQEEQSKLQFSLPVLQQHHGIQELLLDDFRTTVEGCQLIVSHLPRLKKYRHTMNPHDDVAMLSLAARAILEHVAEDLEALDVPHCSVPLNSIEAGTLLRLQKVTSVAACEIELYPTDIEPVMSNLSRLNETYFWTVTSTVDVPDVLSHLPCFPALQQLHFSIDLRTLQPADVQDVLAAMQQGLARIPRVCLTFWVRDAPAEALNNMCEQLKQWRNLHALGIRAQPVEVQHLLNGDQVLPLPDVSVLEVDAMDPDDATIQAVVRTCAGVPSLHTLMVGNKWSHEQVIQLATLLAPRRLTIVVYMSLYHVDAANREAADRELSCVFVRRGNQVGDWW